MKSYIPIDIPTKSYIKAYLMSRYKGKVILNSSTYIGNKFYDLLENKTNEYKYRLENARYNDKVRVYVSKHTFMHRGCNLNHTNVKNFNSFLEDDIKDKFHWIMDTYIDILPVFSAHLSEVRKRLGIDDDSWSDDSMKKDYYRYRKKEGLPMLYEKINAASVPSEKAGSNTF